MSDFLRGVSDLNGQLLDPQFLEDRTIGARLDFLTRIKYDGSDRGSTGLQE